MDKLENGMNKMMGKVKETAGKMTDMEDMELKGKLQGMKADVGNKMEDMKEEVLDKANDLMDKMRGNKNDMNSKL